MKLNEKQKLALALLSNGNSASATKEILKCY